MSSSHVDHQIVNWYDNSTGRGSWDAGCSPAIEPVSEGRRAGRPRSPANRSRPGWLRPYQRGHRALTLNFSTWRELYDSDLQGLYALLVVPTLFLLYRLVRGQPRGARTPAGAFVDGYCIVFALQTLLDPLITGSLIRALGATEGPAATVTLALFVLLGDFRVYLLVFGLIALARQRAWTAAVRPAVAWTLVVPAAPSVLHP